MLFTDEAKTNTWDAMLEQYPALKFIVENSRGRFSRHFAESVVEFTSEKSVANLCDLLDEAFSEVHRRTIRGKNFMNKANGPEAQMMAISYAKTDPVNVLNTSSPGVKRHTSDEWEGHVMKRRRLDVGSICLHVHFANLIDEQPPDIEVAHGNMYFGKGGWLPQCRFLTIDEDLLLYLAVLGGKECSAYFGSKSTLSVFQAFSMHHSRHFQLNLHEEMMAQIIFCASRRNGVRGIHFETFFPCLVGEFQEGAKSKPMTVDGEERTIREIVQGYSDLSELLSTSVPFLAPSNAQWSQCVLDTCENGCNFGHFVHTNQERKGLCVYEAGVSGTPLFLCECNYRDRRLNVDALTEMIDRLDSVWKGGSRVEDRVTILREASRGPKSILET
ncbi:hypothetical protein P3T76_013286 [Phytophthora citrophthora]|uniref:Uncharacterized protein n=1 Tax=Phytophthora citrophthora TaxID=4793 RepID=A0AAD9G333_9STRA|nr:hypothetical protein P3T76_013286 [Phytophthora citrophthora]